MKSFKAPFGAVLVLLGISSGAVAYDEAVDGDLGDDQASSTVIIVPPEGMVISGAMSRQFINGPLEDLDFFTLVLADEVDVVSMNIESGFVDDATKITWQGPATIQTIYLEDPDVVEFLPGDTPLQGGASYNFGYSDSDELSPPYSAEYVYRITVVTEDLGAGQTSVPVASLPAAGLINQYIIPDPTAAYQMIGTIAKAGTKPLGLLTCAAEDPRWEEDEIGVYAYRPARIQEFVECSHIPGFALMDNVVPAWHQANINPAGAAWVGFVFMESEIEFAYTLAGQTRWENVDPRIHVDDCNVAPADRDVETWGTLPYAPYFEDRWLEGHEFQIVTTQCNRVRTLARRGSIFSGPWNVVRQPENVIWGQLLQNFAFMSSAEARRCLPSDVRAGWFWNLFSAGMGLFGPTPDYANYVESNEKAAELLFNNADRAPDCNFNLIGAGMAGAIVSAFYTEDRLIEPDKFEIYYPPAFIRLPE